MKILLTAINAKYIHSNLAVYSLRAAAKQYRDLVEIAEFTINHQEDDILEEIYKRKPDVLMFSCYIWNISMIEHIMVEFHKICPNVPIWLGGPEVSFESEHFLQTHAQVTGIMMGEGEKTFFDLCAYYTDTQGKNWSEIAGITYRDVLGNPKSNAHRDVMCMSDIPFCYDTIEDFSHRIIYYESSRGCPFSCSYCLSSVDKKLRFRDLNLVKQELSFFLKQKVAQVKFVDRTFNCNHAHAMEIWNYILEHDNGVTNFHFEISADLLNEEELAVLKKMRAGLVQLEIGVQSVNTPTIQEIHRTMNLELLKEVVKKIKSFGNIHQHLDLIAGLPYEDYETFRISFDEIYDLEPNQLQMGFLKVLKGSYMYEHAQEYGILYHDKTPYEVLKTNWLTYAEIRKLKRIEDMLEVYYNSGQFEITMKVLKTVYHSAFDMFQKLGDFYEEKKLFGMSHSRIRRCEILLDFLSEEWKHTQEFEERLECIKQALLFDLYYRENCKSRPTWAKDSKEFKKVTHFYCKNGKLSHVEPFSYDFLGNLSAFPNVQQTPVWVLFSYEKRDILSHQANVEYVTPEVDMEEMLSY